MKVAVIINEQSLAVEDQELVESFFEHWEAVLAVIGPIDEVALVINAAGEEVIAPAKSREEDRIALGALYNRFCADLRELEANVVLHELIDDMNELEAEQGVTQEEGMPKRAEPSTYFGGKAVATEVAKVDEKPKPKKRKRKA